MEPRGGLILGHYYFKLFILLVDPYTRVFVYSRYTVVICENTVHTYTENIQILAQCFVIVRTANKSLRKLAKLQNKI